MRQTQRSPEGPRHLHRIPRLSEAPWEVLVSALWVVGEDGMLFVVVSEVLVSASVEVRSLVELSEPVVLVAVDSVDIY